MENHTDEQRREEEEARKEVVRRWAEGKGVLLTERRNEHAEKVLAEQLAKRARAGEHFPSSLRRD